jgi:small-conductance mechanosensitive channel
MKKILLSVSFLLLNSLYAGSFLKSPFFGGDANQQQLPFLVGATPVAEKKQELLSLKDKEVVFAEKDKEEQVSLKQRLSGLNAELAELKGRSARLFGKEKLFIEQKISLLNEIYQALVDAKLVRSEIITLQKKQEEALEEYLRDPQFINFRVKEQTGYKFDELLELNKQAISLDENLAALRQESLAVEADIARSKRNIEQYEREYKVKEREQRDFISKFNSSSNDKIALQQKGELLDLEKELLKRKLDLAELREQKDAYKAAFLAKRIFVTEAKVSVLREDIETVSHKLFIDDTTVKKLEVELTQKKQEDAARQVDLSTQITKLSTQKDAIKREADEIIVSMDGHLPDQKTIEDWSFDASLPDLSPNLYILGMKLEELQEKEQEIQFFDAQREASKVQVSKAEMSLQIINSWVKLIERKLRSDQLRMKELQLLEDKKNELEKQVKQYQDKVATLTTQLNAQSRVVANLDTKKSNLKLQERVFVAHNGIELFRKNLDAIIKSQKLVAHRIDIIGRIIKVYTEISVELQEQIKQVTLLIGRLEKMGGIWRRSGKAISFENILQNVVPDIKNFVYIVKNLFEQSGKYSVIFLFQEIFGNPTLLWQLFLLALFLLFLFVVLRAYLPVFAKMLYRQPERGTFARNFLATILLFLQEHLSWLLIWTYLYVFTQYDFGVEGGILFKLLFFVVSIVYLSYLSCRLINALVAYNVKTNYVYISTGFQKRLHIVLTLFAVSSIAMFFIKEMFVLVLYSKYDVPLFLIRVYSIIFRVSLISLLRKEDIIALIPAHNKIWKWVRSFVEQYYYICLGVFVLFMLLSDPYVGGYSLLIYYVLSCSLWTALLIAVLWYGYVLTKKYSAYLFFKHEEGEAAKERFSSAATWYAVFVTAFIVVAGIFGLFYGSKIWGHPIALHEITRWLNVKIFLIQTDEGALVPVKVSSLVALVGIVFIGVMISKLFERMILKRIFSLLLVEAAVQNTVLQLSFYGFFLLSTLVGLSYVGFSSTKIAFIVGSLLLAIAWAVREAVSDYFAYFTMLLERSVKIGDFIRIGDEATGESSLCGVVRKISLRTTVLRKRNSVNIIVPNSSFMKTPVYNWNYTRGFFALDDMLFTVSYECDAEFVKRVVLKVLDEDRNILKSPHPIVRIDGFADNGIRFLIRGFLSTINVLNQWELAAEIRMKICIEFKKNGIEFAYPTRVIRSIDDHGPRRIPFSRELDSQD